MPHYLDLRFQFIRRRRNALILPLVLLGVSFGQLRATQENQPIRFVSMFSIDADVNGNRTPCQHFRDILRRSAPPTGMAAAERPAACDHVLDIIAGKANPLTAEKPIDAAMVAVDSNLRVLITEPATRTVHVMDFPNRTYFHIDVTRGDRVSVPFGIAVDAANNIYVTDLGRGKIAVYSADGQFLKYIGDFKGEGLFQDPRSIAIDRATGRIYLADTSRNFILVLDPDGNILAQVGKRGGGDGPAEFMQPTDVAIYGSEVFVLDRQNFRIQVLDLDGNFRRQFRMEGTRGNEAKGMAFDSQGRLFVPTLDRVDAFDREGKFLFRFGRSGDKQGEFHTARGICTDSKNRVYVVDSGNHRIQVFQAMDHPNSNSKTEAAQ